MKFSIVTITYNRAHLIGETIQSVLNQTYTDFEHIIIDDGSTDDTEKIVTGFNDDRIRYFKYTKSGKRSFLRNEGIRKATGDFICVLDSDDIWKNNKLEVIGGIFNKNPNVDFVFHNVGFIPEDAIKEEVFSTYKSDCADDFSNDLLEDKILPFPVFTIKKASLENIGLIDENLIDGQHDLYLRAAAKLNLYYCSEKLTFMKKHSQNISKNYLMTHYDDHITTIHKLKETGVVSNGKHGLLLSKVYSKIAYIYQQQKQFQKARENYIKSFQAGFFSYYGFKSVLMYLKLLFK
jgi:glycosyltransferase involved in cell wall biosynthesis